MPKEEKSKADADKMEVETKEKEVKKEEEKPKDPVVELREVFGQCVQLVVKAVTAKERTFMSRAIRQAFRRRKLVKKVLLQQLVNAYLHPADPLAAYLLSILARVPDEDGDVIMEDADTPPPKVEKDALEQEVQQGVGRLPPEVGVFLHLLVVVFCVDRGCDGPLEEAVTQLVDDILAHNRRTMDLLSAKVFFNYFLFHVRTQRYAEVRSRLIQLHRTACLRHDEPSQAVLLNAVLHSFILDNRFAQADKFRLNARLPESASTCQAARSMLYLGHVNAVQLHYSEACSNLLRAIRKAPQHGGIGFRQLTHKLLLVVQLLMGDVPDRAIFRERDLRRSLKPYFCLTQAVRVGDLEKFKEVVSTFEAIFKRDRVYNLILRLRSNVIKTGLRNINLSYSRISLQDICSKLHLEHLEDAAYLVAKAIHDGVIDATIDHEAQCMTSNRIADMYSTQQPQEAFHRRITFCNEIHNGAVKALQFPHDEHKKRAWEELEEETQDEGKHDADTVLDENPDSSEGGAGGAGGDKGGSGLQ